MSHAPAHSKQQGAALIAFFLAVFIAAAAILLRAANNIDRSTQTTVAEQQAMVAIKEVLLAFAFSSADQLPGQPPGRFPCPDTNNLGGPEPTCNHGRGRLPISTAPEPPSPPPAQPGYVFSDYGRNVDRQFWYVVSTPFSNGAVPPLNSSTTGTLSLDAENDIVAIIIAPGEALPGQNRLTPAAQLAAANYLESTNITGTALISSLPANPNAFNDRLLPIYRHEVLPLMTLKAAQRIGGLVKQYEVSNSSYPADTAAFTAALALDTPTGWFTLNQWDDVTQDVVVSLDGAMVPEKVAFRFQDCITTFTVTYSSLAVTRDSLSCGP